MDFGLKSEYHPLRKVAVHTPGKELEEGMKDPEHHHFDPELDPEGFRKEHKAFKDILEREGVKVMDVSEILGPDAGKNTPNLTFTRDSSWVSRSGAIPLGMGLRSRSGEPRVMERFYLRAGIPVTHRLTAGEILEGGGIAYLDEDTIVLGACSRTTPAGLRSLRNYLFLSRDVSRVVELPLLPHEIHIDGVFLPIGKEFLVIHRKSMPPRNPMVYHSDGKREEIPLSALLEGWDIVEVSDSERATAGANVMVLREGKAVQFKVNREVNSSLRDYGWDIIEAEGENIRKGNGGLHCLTCPVLRR